MIYNCNKCSHKKFVIWVGGLLWKEIWKKSIMNLKFFKSLLRPRIVQKFSKSDKNMIEKEINCIFDFVSTDILQWSFVLDIVLVFLIHLHFKPLAPSTNNQKNHKSSSTLFRIMFKNVVAESLMPKNNNNKKSADICSI